MGKELENTFLAGLEQNQEKLIRIYSVYAKDAEDTKDLFQEVLIHIWQSMPSFKSNALLSTWIFRITLNVCLRFRSKAIKKLKPSAFTETYLDYLYKTKEYLNIQKKLLITVLYWYFAPLAIGISLFFLGSIRDTKVLITKFAVLIVAGIVVYFLNKRAVKKQITPRLEKIVELIKVLEE